jgi:hypothetical protein
MFVTIARIPADSPRQGGVAGEAESDCPGYENYHGADDPPHGPSLRVTCWLSL